MLLKNSGRRGPYLLKIDKLPSRRITAIPDPVSS
jgi:hypothetical protein